MDNILMQVSGRKRVVLYSPDDYLNMYIRGEFLCCVCCGVLYALSVYLFQQNYVVFFTGDKSEIDDIDNPDYDRFPLFRNVTAYRAVLEPGDVLFIPGSVYVMYVHFLSFFLF